MRLAVQIRLLANPMPSIITNKPIAANAKLENSGIAPLTVIVPVIRVGCIVHQ